MFINCDQVLLLKPGVDPVKIHSRNVVDPLVLADINSPDLGLEVSRITGEVNN